MGEEAERPAVESAALGLDAGAEEPNPCGAAVPRDLPPMAAVKEVSDGVPANTGIPRVKWSVRNGGTVLVMTFSSPEEGRHQPLRLKSAFVKVYPKSVVFQYASVGADGRLLTLDMPSLGLTSRCDASKTAVRQTAKSLVVSITAVGKIEAFPFASKPHWLQPDFEAFDEEEEDDEKEGSDKKEDASLVGLGPSDFAPHVPGVEAVPECWLDSSSSSLGHGEIEEIEEVDEIFGAI